MRVILHIREIERKKLDPGKISDHHVVVGLIDLGDSVTRFTLLTRDKRKEKSYFLGEAASPAEDLLGCTSGRAEFKTITGIQFARNSLERVMAQLSSLGLADADIGAERVDYIVCTSDAVDCEGSYKGDGLLQAMKNSCKSIFGKECLSPTLPSETTRSELAANVNKAVLVARGMRREIESRYWSLKSTIYIDLSTSLSGLSTIDGSPSSMNGILTGLGGSIFDALAKGYGNEEEITGVSPNSTKDGGRIYEGEAEDLAAKSAELIEVGRVPAGRSRVGMVPVDVNKSYDLNVKMIGCDVGKNGSNLYQLTQLGRRAASYGLATLRSMIDKVCARLIGKLMKTADEEELLLKNTTLGISGHETFEEGRRKLIVEFLKEIGLKRVADRTIFVEDAAPRGAIETALYYSLKNESFG
ncbi:hypothetical protein AKJ45_03690 [candidate division MSBL1 archaeon SCGC-AAA261F19]|uniref:Methanogenesis marker 14 protein n=1 Tax=candidate division MSBL1 archaeon SCGC-AAA261F19 TaxID=1698275 RepID=A0A133V6R9_9EURY|nr:hypothetical protein AKJ45_03690 [candidate division MSBL1 archaeon SCGC-AAA261F19]